MATNYRPTTIEERFFGHTTIVNVPVSAPPENLPEVSTAPVDSTPPVPDLSNSKAADTPSKFEAFISKHWGKILITVVILGVGTGVGYRYYKKQKEKVQENNTTTPAA